MISSQIRSGEQQLSCKQCGVCCVKGGAALHGVDINLLGLNGIPRRDLITLRKGEFAWNPVNNQLEAITTEIIKLRGTGKAWTCLYLDEASKKCRIYERRPIACRILKCWDPKESLALIGTDLLSRMIVLQKETVLLELTERYERNNPFPDFSSMQSMLKKKPERLLKQLEYLVNKDLAFRYEQVRKIAAIDSDELFLFGRPLFQLIIPFGIETFQLGKRLCLRKSAR